MGSRRGKSIYQWIRRELGLANMRYSVVFSCWTKMLDLVQEDLEDEGFFLTRIDGQASLDKRWDAVTQFREDPECTVMLASIGSAGEGYAHPVPCSNFCPGGLILRMPRIDFISACHVHILEPQWNPMTEAQAIGRVHRFGQTERVTVTRYIVRKSIDVVSHCPRFNLSCIHCFFYTVPIPP